MSIPAIEIGISDKDRETISNGLARMLADSFCLKTDLTSGSFHNEQVAILAMLKGI